MLELPQPPATATAMIAASALALYIAVRHGWEAAYIACAAFALPAMLTALVVGEPARRAVVAGKRGLGEVWRSIEGPFREGMKRWGVNDG